MYLIGTFACLLMLLKHEYCVFLLDFLEVIMSSVAIAPSAREKMQIGKHKKTLSA